jgi:hypothetical protein
LAANAKPACPAPMITSLSVTISLLKLRPTTTPRPIPYSAARLSDAQKTLSHFEFLHNP